MKKNYLSAILFAVVVLLGSAVRAEAPAATSPFPIVKMNGMGGKNIVEVAVGSPDHKTLVKAVLATGLDATLSGPGPYTVFAPTDAAFAKLPAGTVEGLLKPEKIPTLKAILEHHAAAPAFLPNILVSQTELDMVENPKLKVESRDGGVFVDGVQIKAAVLATNGVVYVIDSVLLPPSK